MISVHSNIFDCPTTSQAVAERNMSLALSHRSDHMRMIGATSFGHRARRAVLKYRKQFNIEVQNILEAAEEVVICRRSWASLPLVITSESLLTDPLSGQNLKPMVRWIDEDSLNGFGINSPHAAYADDACLSAMVPRPDDLFGAYVLFHEVGHCLWERHCPATDLLTCVTSEAAAILYQRFRMCSLLPGHVHGDFFRHEQGSAALTAKMMVWEWGDQPCDQAISLIQPALLHLPGYQIVMHLAEEVASHSRYGSMPDKSAIIEWGSDEIERFFSDF